MIGRSLARVKAALDPFLLLVCSSPDLVLLSELLEARACSITLYRAWPGTGWVWDGFKTQSVCLGLLSALPQVIPLPFDGYKSFHMTV